MAFSPNQLRYSEDGIPILKARQIEDIATEVLDKYCPKALRVPVQTPVLEIIQELGKTTGLQSSILDLGYKNGAKILGLVNFSRKLLSLDNLLAGERKVQMRFTAAHEIGHWILHRWNYKNWRFAQPRQEQETLQDDEETLCRLDERTPQDWLEWQANVFAASLVLPRATFLKALVETQLFYGITRNVGKVWISDADYSRRDFQLVSGSLANIYGVSLTSIRVRLNTFNLLNDETSHKGRSVSQSLCSNDPPF
ncbi:MAG: ImmA/IrrE family metallo-endopeptidase [Verrucomicrobiota bacterium]